MTDHNWFEWLIGIVVAVIAWLGNRLHIRVDAIEASRAKNEDLNAVRSAIEELRRHVDSKFDAQTQQIIDMMRDKR